MILNLFIHSFISFFIYVTLHYATLRFIKFVGFVRFGYGMRSANVSVPQAKVLILGQSAKCVVRVKTRVGVCIN